MAPDKRQRISLFPLALALFVALTAFAPLLHAQDSEWAKRDAWQRPAEVMDALGVKQGSVVADIGAGGGYFTFHLAARVGPAGKVYAEDISDSELERIRKRASDKQLTQIAMILGTPRDPRLPAEALDAVLVVNAYHEFLEYDAMMQAMYRALKPGGLLAIIDAADAPGESRKTYQHRHRLPPQIVREDADRNGFRFMQELPGFDGGDSDRKYYFLLFSKPESSPAKVPGPAH